MSRAFDRIHDPNDPAWDGYVDVAMASERRSRLQRRVVSILILCAVAITVLTAWIALRDGDPVIRAPRTLSAVATTSTTTPVPATPAPARRAAAAIVPMQPTVKAAPTGSGWAPAEATVLPGDRATHLTGDLDGLRPSLIDTLDQLAAKLGRRIEVVSGWRTHHEQRELYGMYQRGTGNLAAVPGTSMHETGDAADVYVDGVALASVPGARELARSFGLHFPVPGEAWHVESM